MPKSRSLNVTNMSLNAIRENKILAKISEFRVIFLLLKRNMLWVLTRTVSMRHILNFDQMF